MSKLIPNALREGLYCFFCGTDKSVKYLKTIIDSGPVKDMLVTVCCCNKCIVRFSDESK